MINPNDKPTIKTEKIEGSRRWFLGVAASTAAGGVVSGPIKPSPIKPLVDSAKLIPQIIQFNMKETLGKLFGGLLGNNVNRVEVDRALSILRNPKSANIQDLENHIQYSISGIFETLQSLPSDSTLKDLASEEFLEGMKIAYPDFDIDAGREKVRSVAKLLEQFGVRNDDSISEVAKKLGKQSMDIAESLIEQFPDGESWHTQHIKNFLPDKNNPRAKELLRTNFHKNYGVYPEEMEEARAREWKKQEQKAIEDEREAKERPSLLFVFHPEIAGRNDPRGSKVFVIHNSESYYLKPTDVFNLLNVNNLTPKLPIIDEVSNGLRICVSESDQIVFFSSALRNKNRHEESTLKIQIPKDRAKDFI